MVMAGFSSCGSFEKRHQLSTSRISFCIPMIISSLIFPGTGYIGIDWVWLRGWLNNRGEICTGTAPLFWNLISLFERPRTRLVGKIGYQSQFIIIISNLTAWDSQRAGPKSINVYVYSDLPYHKKNWIRRNLQFSLICSNVRKIRNTTLGHEMPGDSDVFKVVQSCIKHILTNYWKRKCPKVGHLEIRGTEIKIMSNNLVEYSGDERVWYALDVPCWNFIVVHWWYKPVNYSRFVHGARIRYY